MRKLPKLAIVGALTVAAGTAAVAAKADKHVMDVPLADGSTVRVEYYGDVAPTVRLVPGSPIRQSWMWSPMAMPGFADFGRIFDRIERQRDQITRAARSGAPAAPLNVVSFGDAPAGSHSVSVVSVSNGGTTCTRTTEVTSLGRDKPPKVVSKVSGDCSAGQQPVQPSAVPRGTGPIDHT